MKKAKIILTVLLTGIIIGASGCGAELVALAAVGAGAGGTVAYVKGDLETTLDAGMDKSYAASLKALDQLQIVPTQKLKDSLSAEIIARRSDDTKITVALTRVDDKITKMSIRVGVFGDQAQSTTIYERVKQNLKGAP
jgi:stress response protein SCP2